VIPPSPLSVEEKHFPQRPSYKRGAPPIPPGESRGDNVPRKRDIQVKVWLNEDEVIKLDSLIEKSRTNKSDYLRKAILGKNVTVIDGLKEFTTELNRIGVNLNQLTKSVHYGEIADCSQELGHIQEELREVWQSLNDFLRKVR
jgi:hypothetical protein